MSHLSGYTVAVAPFEETGTNYIANAPISIYVRNTDGSSGALANIFSDSHGLNSITQTGATCDDRGQFTFYAAPTGYNAISNGVVTPIDVGVTSEVLVGLIGVPVKTLAEAVADASAAAGMYVDISDRGMGRFQYLTGQASDGFGSVSAQNSLTLKAVITKNQYSIVHFGAIDGAANNTTPMRATMEAAALSGGTYYLPSGLWIHEQIDWRKNVNGRGEGENSIDERISDPTNPTTTKVGYRFFNSDTVPPFNRALNIRNIDITGIKFRGTTVIDGFSEQKHLLMIQGGTDIKIHGCWFEGWQGDAIVIRSGNFTAAAQNENIRIINNQFNGVNRNNRNAITFNDCSGLWIMFNNFLNCTRDGDAAWVNPSPYDGMDQASGPAMPGAIDCEPNIGDTFVVIKNINILYNTFASIGGNVAAISFFLPTEEGAYTNGDPQNINIVGNTGDAVFKGIHLAQDQNADVTDASFNSNYKVTLNHFKNTSNSPFWYYGIKGIDAYENTWEDCALQGYVGWLIGLPNRGCNSIKVSDTFKHVGGGVALTIYNSDRIDLLENTFDNCGAPGGGFGIPIDIGTGVSSRIRINRNTYINNEGLMTAAVSTSGTLTPGNNELIGNDLAGLSAGFLAETTDSGENTVDDSVIATAGGQAAATQLSNAMNIVVSAAAFDSIKLPTSEGTARQISISNRAGVTIQIYPFSGDNLGNGTNSPISLVAGSALSFKSFSVNDWMQS